MATNKTAVLIGHNFNSILGLARALGIKGWEVSAIRTVYKKKKSIAGSLGLSPESRSKYISFYKRIDGNNTAELLHTLKKISKGDSAKGILLPVDDLSAIFVDENLSELSNLYYVPNVDGTPGEVIHLMDKYYQKQLAIKAGLPVPRGWSIHIEGGTYQISEDISYPCFAKTETPILGRKLFMGKCNSREELDKLLDRTARACDCEMLVEEYIPIEKEYGCVGVSDGSRVCIPGFTEKIMLGHGTNAGVTVCGKIHIPDEYPETWNRMKEFISSTRFQGIFDIDLYEADGIVYFNELNVRMGAEGVGTLLAGVNLAEMFANIVQNEGLNETFDVKAQPITFINERPLYSDYGENYISWKQCKEALCNVDQKCIYARDDKGPYYDSLFFVLRQWIRRNLRSKRRKK